MDKYMESAVLPILKSVDSCWQPADFLPDSSSPDFQDQARVMHAHWGNVQSM
jgi:acyl-[acyl-carrier-protein] desaturase